MSDMRSCRHCGSVRTLKGNPLTGMFCSPKCLHDHMPEGGEFFNTLGCEYINLQQQENEHDKRHRDNTPGAGGLPR